MLLTDAEIANLTKKTQRAPQRAVLNFLGIQHKVRPDGSLVVSKSHVEQVLGVKVTDTAGGESELDFSDAPKHRKAS